MERLQRVKVYSKASFADSISSDLSGEELEKLGSRFAAGLALSLNDGNLNANLDLEKEKVRLAAAGNNEKPSDSFLNKVRDENRNNPIDSGYYDKVTSPSDYAVVATHHAIGEVVNKSLSDPNVTIGEIFQEKSISDKLESRGIQCPESAKGVVMKADEILKRKKDISAAKFVEETLDVY